MDSEFVALLLVLLMVLHRHILKKDGRAEGWLGTRRDDETICLFSALWFETDDYRYTIHLPKRIQHRCLLVIVSFIH